jgi:hypothetical protein
MVTAALAVAAIMGTAVFKIAMVTVMVKLVVAVLVARHGKTRTKSTKSCMGVQCSY